MIEKVAIQIHDFIKWLIIGMETVETPQPSFSQNIKDKHYETISEHNISPIKGQTSPNYPEYGAIDKHKKGSPKMKLI